jgi:hypothetical protein
LIPTALNSTSFTCECQADGLFYGQYCENIKNLCENVTCSSHGYCTQIQSEIQCKCFKGYDGKQCEIESNTIKAVKSVQMTATIISIVFLIIFWIIIIGTDVLDYFEIGNEHIDMDEWRREKFHGEKAKPKKAKKFKKKKIQSHKSNDLKEKDLKM